MDIIVFGTGEIGKAALPFLEKEYHILFFTDNNEKKWGTTFEKYRIESPDEIRKYNCAIVIASTKYSLQIAGQLEKMGVCQDRIYFCHRFQSDDIFEVEVYPLLELKLKGTSKLLVQYDICNVEEHETSNRKVLIFCRSYSVYTKQLIENMSKKYSDIEFSLLTQDKTNKEKILSDKLKHIYCFQSMTDLKTILELLPIYDVAHLLWMDWELAYMYRLIRKKCRVLNLNVGGSDFYRAGAEEREAKKSLIACADRIMAQTEATVREFVEYYGEIAKNKTYLLPYGIEVLEWINSSTISKTVIKEKYHIPIDKIVITCGHNANEAHQHLKIIDAVEKLPEGMKEQLVCVFPMTYPPGKDLYIRQVRDRLEKSGINHVILTEFMNFQEMAEYARISDIMIHVQITDQLSSAMLEEMYAGSIVVAGSWLPYKSLHDMGIFFMDVDSVSDTSASLEDIFIKIEEYKKRCAGNREIIWKHSSWDGLAPKWDAIWRNYE